MATINRVPQGMLGLLDAKTGGRTPQDSVGLLQPVLDLSPNYYADIPLQVATTTATNVGSIGLFAPVVVPAGELWLLEAVSVESVCTNALDMNLAVVGLSPNTTSIGVQLSQSDWPGNNWVPTTVGTRINSAFCPGEVFLLGPGTTLYNDVLVVLGGATVTNITRVLYRSLVV